MRSLTQDPSRTFSAFRRPSGPRLILATTELVVAAGAIYGGIGLLSDAEGMGAKTSWLRGSVFPDYTVPGLVLLVVIGGGMVGAAIATVLGSPRAGDAAVVMALLLLAWGAVETITIGWQGPIQLLLVASFVIVPAIVLVWVGRRLRVRR